MEIRPINEFFTWIKEKSIKSTGIFAKKDINNLLTTTEARIPSGNEEVIIAKSGFDTYENYENFYKSLPPLKKFYYNTFGRKSKSYIQELFKIYQEQVQEEQKLFGDSYTKMFSVTNKQNDNTDSKKSNNPGLQLAVRCGAIKNSYGIDIIRDASSYKILLLCKKNNCVPELDFSLSHQALNKMRI